MITSDRPRVFCASLADWLDNEVPIEWLADLLALIHTTPNLDWLLLTKRPENWRSRLEAVREFALEREDFDLHGFVHAWLDRFDMPAPSNVWIGTTVEDQARADERIPLLLTIPARVRFLSCEPLLEAVDLRFTNGMVHGEDACDRRVDWVIGGGESGPRARPMHPDWASSLRDQCAAAGVRFCSSQWGEWWPLSTTDGRQILPFGEYLLPDSKGNGGFGFLKRGKHAAGRLLDGREHNEFPDAREAANA